MIGSPPNPSPKRAAILGLVLILSLAIYALTNFLNFNLGIAFLNDPLNRLLENSANQTLFKDLSPLIFLGGLGLALWLAWGQS